jgi:Carbamoyl-phosphate synthase small chain, CPSase domain
MPTIASLPDTTPPDATGPASFSRPGLLALEGGTVLDGRLRGARLPAEGDLIFTTASTGWGEILTDPSFAGQIVILTHPMVGSYRIDRSELESSRVHARALVATRLVTPPDGPHSCHRRHRHAGPDPRAAARRGPPRGDPPD